MSVRSLFDNDNRQIDSRQFIVSDDEKPGLLGLRVHRRVGFGQ